MFPDSSAMAGKEVSPSATLDALLATKTWLEAFQMVREQSDELLTEAVCDALRQRIAQLRRRREFWRRRRWRRQLRSWQDQLDILEDARLHGIEEAQLNFYMKQMKRQNPLAGIMFDQIEQYPQLKEAFMAALQGAIAGQNPEHIFESYMGTVEQMESLGKDKQAFQEYVHRLIRQFQRDRSPQAMAQFQEMIAVALEVAAFGENLEQLDRLVDDEPGITSSDVAERRFLLVQDLRQQIEKIQEPLLAAIISLETARTLFAAQRGDLPQDERKDRLEQCITLLDPSIPVLRRNKMRLTWGMAQLLLGNAYSNLNGITGRHKQQAIAALKRGISVIDRRTHPDEWTSEQRNLGAVYMSGWRSAADQEHAIQACRRALGVRTEEDEIFRAWVQMDLGHVFLERRKGSHRRNLEKAVAWFDQALRAFESMPEVMIIFNEIYSARARALEQLGRLEEAHQSLEAGRRHSDLFIERGNSLLNLAGSGYDRISGIFLQDVQILLQMKPVNWQEIAVVLEEGRARSLRRMLNLDEIDLQMIDPALASDLIAARDAWQQAFREDHAPLPPGMKPSDLEAIELHRQRWQRLSASRTEFERIRDAIRSQYPQFLAPELHFDDIARAVTAPDEALVYLVANEKGGMALILTRAPDGTPEVEGLPLSDLTRDSVNILLFGDTVNPLDHQPNPSIRPARGYYYAQISDPLEPLRRWGDSLFEALYRLQRSQTGPGAFWETIPFWNAINRIIVQYHKNLTLMAALDKPFDALKNNAYQKISLLFMQELLKVELPHVLEELGTLGLTRVAQRLAAKKIHKVGLVPYGRLGLFPLPAVQVATAMGTKCLGNCFDVTIVPSARAYQVSKERATATDFRARPAIMLVGDPELPPGAQERQLDFAMAEVGAISRIARAYADACTPAERALYGLAAIGVPLVGAAARKSDVIDGFGRAWLIDLAAHGIYHAEAPLQSRILLAHGEAITLGECLIGTIPVRGARLIILSACEQSIIDVRESENEVVGMPMGFIQAGAAGVLAPLWAVDDGATFLLMARFSELYLDPAIRRSPAQALAEAQRWLREEATNAVLAEYEPVQTLKETLRASLYTNKKRSLRHGYDSALDKIHQQARDDRPDALPYANPFYWAGFAVTGY